MTSDQPATEQHAPDPQTPRETVVEPQPSHPGTPAGRSPVRLLTIVWGAVLAALGGAVLAVAGGARFDVQLAVIACLGLAGLALLIGSLVASARRRPRGPR